MQRILIIFRFFAEKNIYSILSFKFSIIFNPVAKKGIITSLNIIIVTFYKIKNTKTQ